MRKIGIFGGSFDPPHREHKSLVEQAIKSLDLDKVYIVPAKIPPHKKNKSLSSDKDRLEMCRLAFSDLPCVEISDYELNAGGVSYTYLTCRYFKERHPESQLFWFVGTDMLRNFPTWKNPEEILANATLAVCARNEEQGWLKEEEELFQARFQRDFALIDYQGKDVSSTQIRVLAGAGMDITAYTGETVAAYINRTGLYAIPFADTSLSFQTAKRRAHSIRVALLAARRAPSLKVSERKAIAASLFHDCAKNIPADSPCLSGFEAQGVPKPVWHQYAGAYLTEHLFGVQDEEILNAVRYHTSGRENMQSLEKLIFLADMLEEEREFPRVDELRALFWEDDTLDECMCVALKETLLHLKNKGSEIYPLTQNAYEYYQKITKK